MKTYLEYKDEKSHKFWEITLNDSSHTVRYGKIGTIGQSKTLNFPSEEEAQKAIGKLIQSKRKKGYVEITKEEKKDKLALEEANKVVIEVTNLNQEKSYLEALDKMVVLTQNLEAIKRGNLLIFRVKDREKFEEDAVFFEKAIKVAGAAEKIAQVISNLKAHDLYIDDETPAGTYAALALVHKDKKWIPNYINFLRSCDLDHEVEQSADIQKVIEKHGWCEETCRLAIARLVSCGGQFGEEQFKEFLKNGLNDYLKVSENRIMFLKNVIREFNEADKINRYLSYPKEQYLHRISMWVKFFEMVLTEKEMETLHSEVSILWNKHNKKKKWF